VISEWWIWKKLEGRGRGLILRYFSAFAWRDWGKRREFIKRRGRVVITPASYSSGPGFKSWSGNGYPDLRIRQRPFSFKSFPVYHLLFFQFFIVCNWIASIMQNLAASYSDKTFITWWMCSIVAECDEMKITTRSEVEFKRWNTLPNYRKFQQWLISLKDKCCRIQEWNK
jgi:hypothetical protein